MLGWAVGEWMVRLFAQSDSAIVESSRVGLKQRITRTTTRDKFVCCWVGLGWCTSIIEQSSASSCRMLFLPFTMTRTQCSAVVKAEKNEARCRKE